MISAPSPPSYRDVSVLVTGATGLLGSWLVRALRARGAQVIALIRDQVPGSALRVSGDEGQITVVRGAVEDGISVERALHEYAVSAVFHLAAQTIVSTARAWPGGTLDTNVRGTWCVLDACRRADSVRGIVVASSDKAYGDQGQRSCEEGDPLLATHPYDVSKACADQLTRGFAATYGLPAAVTRCGNLYGGGDLQWSRVIPGTIRSLLRGERPVVRSTGMPVRDYLYVEDAVDFYLALMSALIWPQPGKNVAGSAFNASPGQPVKVLDIVDMLQILCGRPDLAPIILGQTGSEIPYQALSPVKARQELSWEAKTPMLDGLSRTLAWYREILGIS